jgi:uncharacterized protein (TIGR03905 family)
MKQAVYYTQGTCSQQINITLNDDNTIEHVEFVGGCHGNTTGISLLVKGMKAQDVISKLEGVRCGYKATSCPDQLARALRQMLATQQ